jgi:outer membrane protein
MKHVTLTLIALLASLAGADAQTSATLSLPLSLHDAIALGLEHNRSVANASMQVDKAEQDIAVARSRRLPSFTIEAQGSQLLRPINLTFARGAFGEFPGIGPVPGNDTNITTPARLNFVVTAEAQQPLTQLIKLNLNVRLNEAMREYERERVRDARLGLVDEIRRLYYSIAQTRSALDASDHTLAMLRELDRLVTVRMAQQVALKGDGLTVQSRIAQTELTRLSRSHALASQKEQLNQMIGRDLRTPFDVVDIPDASIEEVDLEVAQNRATEARPDIRQARVRLQQAELARRAARADYLPDVGLSVSYISPINIDGAPRQIATAAIQAQWEPWDWGRKGRAVASKELDIRQAKNQVHETEERAVLDINSRFRKLEEARAHVRAARIGQDAARENARVRVTQYEVQAALLSDVLQTQATMADSNSQYQQALTAFWSARADFERALGEEIR